MSLSLDEVGDKLHDFFASKFPAGAGRGPGTIQLIFDSLGTPLSPAEFVGSGTDAAQDVLAHQRAAQLADQLPASNFLAQGWYVPRSGSRLSTWYSAVVGSAACVSADAAWISAFEALKRDATRSFQENKLSLATGSALGGPGGTPGAAGSHDQYYATSMSPTDWFTDTSVDWQHYELSGDDAPSPPAATDSSWSHRPRFAFRVAHDFDSADLSAFVAQALPVRPAHPQIVDPIQSPSLLRAVQFRAGGDVFANALQHSHSLSGATISAGLSPAMETSASHFASVAAADGPVVLTSNFHKDSIVQHLVAEGAFQRIDVGLAREATTSSPPTSDNFHISFDYCLVRFDRPWWDELLLLSRGWQSPGYPPGTIASGSADDLSAPVTLMTIGMVLVRNLSITANWSAADRISLATSISLGPFCIAGGDYDNNSGRISRPGVQAIGWLCQVPPTLPPILS